jgi:hypothetical protein
VSLTCSNAPEAPPYFAPDLHSELMLNKFVNVPYRPLAVGYEIASAGTAYA